MESQNRLFLALALSFALTTVYVLFFSPPAVPPAVAPDAGTAAAAATPPPPVPPSAAVVEPPPANAPPTEVAPVKEITVTRPGARYRFSTAGGVLESAVLEGTKTREQQQVGLMEGWRRLFGKRSAPPPQMNLAQPLPGGPSPLAVSVESEAGLPADARYAVQDSTPNRLAFRAEQNGWAVVKALEWPEKGHELLYVVSVRNASGAPRTGELRIHFTRAIDPKSEEAPSMLGGVGNQASAVCRVGTDLHRRTPSSDPADEYTGPVGFVGVDHQYFLSGFFALDAPPEGRCVLDATPTMRRAMAALPLTLNPGEVRTFHFGVYLGPKSVDELTAVPSAALTKLAERSGVTVVSDPELERFVDFGIWAVICKVLLFFLNMFHGWVKNWGLAIVVLTFGVKLVLLPLTHRSMVGMEAMKRLQPRMEEIKKKFPNDRERQQQETMKMYQEAKVNPFGSCLLMLVQMPVWFALYTTLRTSYELYNESFLSPIWTDLTYKDPTYVLPVLLGVTMVMTSKLQPPAADPVQAKMLTWFMPIMFTFLLLNTPAGLTLYMVTNNVLSIAQTFALRRWLAVHPEKIA